MEQLKKPGGRPPSNSAAYAKEIGIGLRQLWRLGGEARLRAMQPEARDFLISLAKKSGTDKNVAA